MRSKADDNLDSLDHWKDQPSANQRPTRTPEERRAHLLNSIVFVAGSLLIAGVNLFALSTVIEALLGNISGLIPNVLSDAASFEVAGNIYNGLVTQDQELKIVAERAAVGAVGRHRVVGVAGEHDASRDRGLLADEPVRVAMTVPALVT